MFEINPNLQVNAYRLGNEQTPLLVVDDVMLDYSAAQQEACSIAYSSDKDVVGAYYPGIRAPVGEAYGMALLRYSLGLFYRFFLVPQSLTLHPKNGSYSLITQQPQEMDLLQCIPHFDNNETFSFAMIHYLNEGDFGGTGFYRHKPTGYENITQGRRQQYLHSAQEFIDSNGNPEQQYFTDSTAHYELLHKVGYKPNRLLIYPATILHSAYIDNPKHDVNNDPKTGRLSANFFIEFK
jgi:hypothetical protein